MPEPFRDMEKTASPYAPEGSDAASETKPEGVSKVEAANSVWGPKSKWFFFFGLALSAYVYSLDGMTTYQYLSYATSYVLEHSLSGTVSTATGIIIAVGKPFFAKFADVLGRGESIVAIALLYAVGYAIIASANGIGQIAGGSVVYTLGYTGLQIIQQIIVADVTTLRWRGLVAALLSAPFIINAFVASEIAARILGDTGYAGAMAGNPTDNWRWGYGMFAIIMPVTLTPIIVALLWSQRRGRQLQRARGELPPARKSFGAKAMEALREMDFVGLVLVGTSLALILLPLGLAPKAKGGWKNASMIAMLVIGCLLFPVFLVYEWKVPKRPVLPVRWLKRTPILGACLIGFFDFVSFYLQFQYLYSYIMVTQPGWSVKNQGYYIYTQTIALTVFGIIAGLIMYATRRFKWMLVSGLLVRLLGVGIMFHARGPSGNTASLVMCQVLQGLGGGFAATAIQVAAQASVSHADVATVTAMVLLLTEVGNAVGTAAATGVWTQYMPQELATYVPTTNTTLLNELFGSITMIATYPPEDPIRLGAITAYQHLMHRLLIGSVVVACFPPIFAFFLIKDVRLGDTQNAHDGKDLAGDKLEESQVHGAR